MSPSPAGWYPDADGTMRYWDGLAWTDGPTTNAGATGRSTTLPVPQVNHTMMLSLGPSTSQLTAQAGPYAAGASDDDALTFTSTPRDDRPWFQRKRFIVPGALGVLVVIALLLTGGGDDTPPAAPIAAPAATSTDAPTTSDPTPSVVPTISESVPTPTEKPTTTAPTTIEQGAPASRGTYDDAFGTFERFTEKGHGDGVVNLPQGVTAALVRAVHQGGGAFAVQVLDANNQRTSDLLVSVVGAYAGTTAYGFTDFGAAPAKLQITAEGDWALSVSPMGSAPRFDGSASGTGDRVFRYDGDASSLRLRHRGDSGFSVVQIGQGYPDVLVNHQGGYSGTVPMSAGPSIITIRTSGEWVLRKV